MIKTQKKLALRTQTMTILTEGLASVTGGRRSQCSYEQSGCIQETKPHS